MPVLRTAIADLQGTPEGSQYRAMAAAAITHPIRK
jgi:hypothetical protein